MLLKSKLLKIKTELQYSSNKFNDLDSKCSENVEKTCKWDLLFWKTKIFTAKYHNGKEDIKWLSNSIKTKSCTKFHNMKPESSQSVGQKALSSKRNLLCFKVKSKESKIF